MNLRGVANSTYEYALYNQKLLKNKSIIFFNKKNSRNLKEIINKFKKKFRVIGVNNFSEIDDYQKLYKLKYIYTQKGGEKDSWNSQKIKTLIHAVYPQKLTQIHGHKYAFISEWLSKSFANNKVEFVPYIVKKPKIKKDLKASLRIKKDQLVFGCHGGSSSFDLNFVKDAIKEIVQQRQDITFLFLNIDSFANHPRIKFLKGTSNEIFKQKFINSCDAMIYGRSLGESFGHACGEFAVSDKPIISYKFIRHKSHLYNLSSNRVIEYYSRKSLFNILDRFKKNIYFSQKYKNKYKDYSAQNVMRIFNRVFLKQADQKPITVIDYIVNLLNYLQMHIRYIKHKLYHHYYKLVASRLIY